LDFEAQGSITLTRKNRDKLRFEVANAWPPLEMTEYARFGVPYFWLVDPALGAFAISDRTPAGNYQKLVGVTSGSIDSVPGRPGLVIDVDALWAELARLRNDE
jgi:Uma2 family endonuclease